MSRLHLKRVISDRLCGHAVRRTWTGLISANQFTNPHSCFRRQTGLGCTNSAKTINTVPHSSQSKRKSDISFPFSRGSCCIIFWKRLSRNEVTVCNSGFPVPWSKNSVESFTQSLQLSENRKTNHGSKPASASNVTKLSQIKFLWHSFPVCTVGSHNTGSCCAAWKAYSTTIQSLLCHHLSDIFVTSL